MTSIQQNIKHLRDILVKPEFHPNEEMLEFLEAIENDADDMQGEIDDAKKELDELKEDDEDQEFDAANSDFVGLDTIKWELVNGNIKIQMQMEKFIAALKTENCASVRY